MPEDRADMLQEYNVFWISGPKYTHKNEMLGTLYKNTFVLKSLSVQFTNQMCRNEMFKNLCVSKALLLNKLLPVVETE